MTASTSPLRVRGFILYPDAQSPRAYMPSPVSPLKTVKDESSSTSRVISIHGSDSDPPGQIVENITIHASSSAATVLETENELQVEAEVDSFEVNELKREIGNISKDDDSNRELKRRRLEMWILSVS